MNPTITKKYKNQLQELSSALLRFEEAPSEQNNPLVLDASTQRIEFCFDLLWKCSKQYLEEVKGIVAKSPNETWKELFGQDIIDGEFNWLGVTADRNMTVHTYDQRIAEGIFKKLPEYLEEFKELYQKIHIKH